MARIARSQDEFTNGVVQLRFADEEHNVKDINAAELAEVLQGLVEFTSQMTKTGLLGDGVAPEVRVRPPQPGSFIVEAVLQWAGENPMEAITGSISVGGAMVEAIHLGIRALRGDEPSDVDYLENGDVKIKWPGEKMDQVPAQAWDQLRTMPRKTRRALRKLMAPLADADVDTLEVRTGGVDDTTSDVLQSAPAVTAGRTDYVVAAAETDEVEERTRVFEAEARLTSIDFRPGEKWRVETREGTRQASMEDDSFLLAVDRGMALHKNDIFEVTIREDQTIKNGRTSTNWALIAVRLKRRGSEDGNDELSAPSRS